MNDPHPLDVATSLAAVGDGLHRGATSADYANMVGPFGGTLAAVVLAAPCGAPERLGDPTALTINYCGPVADGVFDVTAHAVRTNRTNQHWSMTLAQGGVTAITASAVFTLRRPTWRHTEARMPTVPPAAAVERATNAGRPPWTRRYDMRFVRGTMHSLTDAQSGAEPMTWVWLADDPPRPLDFLSLAAMCDAFFPRIFLRRPRWTPAGTISLTIHFHADATQLAGQAERPLLGMAWASHFGNGVFDEHVELWSDAGELLATAHQVVYFKE